MRYGAILALFGLAAEFLLQGPYAAGRRVAAVTDLTLLGDTGSSAFGRWHVAAIVALCGLSAAAVRARRAGRSGRDAQGPGAATAQEPSARVSALRLQVVCAAGWILVLAAVAASGHAGVRAPVWLGLAVTVAHLLAMTTWIGGLVVLALVLIPRTDHRDSDESLASLLPVFSRVAMVCVAALAATGTYQAWQEIGSWSALFDTTYGELVLTKIELFGVLVALGAVARARVAAWPSGPAVVSRLGVRRSVVSARLRTGILLELGVAAAVLCVSAVLVAEPPGRDAAVTTTPATTATTVTAQLSPSRTVTVRVTPARAGPVSIEVAVSPGPAVQKLTVTAAQNVAGVGPLPVAVRAGAGVYRSEPVDLPVAGDWQFTVTVQISAFDVSTATPTLRLD